MRTSEIVARMREKFPVQVWHREAQLDEDFPAPKVPSVRHFRKTAEADANLRNKSASDLAREGVECITLRERLLMELAYFEETGKHLDIEGFTICAGSRYSDGRVPHVCWDPNRGKVRIDWCDVDRSYDDHAAREAVLPPNPSPLAPSNPSLDEAIERVKAEGYVVYRPV